MEETIPITEARKKLTSLPEELAEKPRAISVTRKGKPVLAVLPWELYESLLETLEIMGDEDLMDALRQAVTEVAQGKTLPWEKARAEVIE
jgi:antitoxin YefM